MDSSFGEKVTFFTEFDPEFSQVNQKKNTQMKNIHTKFENTVKNKIQYDKIEDVQLI